MKILLAGNMANLGYMTAKQLKKCGIDVTLLMEKNPILISDPIKNDKSLEGKFPEWIKFFDLSSKTWPLDIIKEMRKKNYDIIHAFVELPMFTLFSQKSLVVQTQGSDLRELAFTKSIKGFMLRRAYKKCRVLLHSSPDYFPLIPKLGIKNDVFLPIPVDYNYFSPSPISHKQRKELIVFHPSNLDWRLKGNNIFIEGFAKFVTKNHYAKLIIIDRGIDSKRTHDLVNSLKIDNNVEFIPGPLNHQQLLQYYQSSDVIADQFIVPCIGAIGLETLSCGKSLITHCPNNAYKDNYTNEPPLLNASTSNEVFVALEKLEKSQFREDLGLQARLWIKKYHSTELYIKKLLVIYESILKRDNINELRLRLKFIQNNKLSTS